MIRKAASFFRSFDLEKTPSKMAKVELRARSIITYRNGGMRNQQFPAVYGQFE